MISRKRPPTHPVGILKRHYLEPFGLQWVPELACAAGMKRASYQMCPVYAECLERWRLRHAQTGWRIALSTGAFL